MNALNRLKQLLGLPEDAAEETLQAELDKLESLLTPANPAASPLSDEERFVCAQLGLSEAEYLAVRG